MSKMSKEKGKTGEREAAQELNKYFPGIQAKRGVQYQGGVDSPDIVHSGPKSIHIEVKRTERFRIYTALDQATQDAGKGRIPIVLHRQNKREWLVIVRLSDLPTLAKDIVTWMTKKLVKVIDK